MPAEPMDRRLVSSHPTTRQDIERAYRRIQNNLPKPREVHPDDNLVMACLMLASSVIHRQINDHTAHDIATLEAEIAMFKKRAQEGGS